MKCFDLLISIGIYSCMVMKEEIWWLSRHFSWQKKILNNDNQKWVFGIIYMSFSHLDNFLIFWLAPLRGPSSPLPPLFSASLGFPWLFSAFPSFTCWFLTLPCLPQLIPAILNSLALVIHNYQSPCFWFLLFLLQQQDTGPLFANIVVESWARHGSKITKAWTSAAHTDLLVIIYKATTMTSCQ